IVTPYIRDAFNQLGIDRDFRDYRDGEYRYHVPGMAYSELSHRAHRVHLENPDGGENSTCTQCHQLNMWNHLIDSAVGGHGPLDNDGRSVRIFPARSWMPHEDARTGSEEERLALESLRAWARSEKRPLKVTDEPVRIQW